MNPCDHPHGGGEGKGSPPRAHKTPWGKLTKSPTKNKKYYKKKKKDFKIFKKK
jgi:large subunit ribosomal protein L2